MEFKNCNRCSKCYQCNHINNFILVVIVIVKKVIDPSSGYLIYKKVLSICEIYINELPWIPISKHFQYFQLSYGDCLNVFHFRYSMLTKSESTRILHWTQARCHSGGGFCMRSHVPLQMKSQVSKLWSKLLHDSNGKHTL